MRAIRGDRIAMIFQEPMSSLNPALTVGMQIAEPVHLHRGAALGAGARRRQGAAAARCSIPDAASRLRAYPHQFSGGMRQRAMIAMALACKPRLIIADEPTTALDVTVQAQILDLLKELTRETGAALILITHDLGVVARYADRVVVMYGGRVVETAPARAALRPAAAPVHARPAGLGAAPRRRSGRAAGAHRRQPPDLAALPPGCAFAPRCTLAVDACHTTRPRCARCRRHMHMHACLLDGEYRRCARRAQPQGRSEHAASAPTARLLRVEDLKVHFP